jgi:hypothetical protein
MASTTRRAGFGEKQFGSPNGRGATLALRDAEERHESG